MASSIGYTVMLSTGLPTLPSGDISKAQEIAFAAWGDKPCEVGHCRLCAKAFTEDDLFDIGGNKIYPGACDDCQPLVNDHFEMVEKQESCETEWEKTCPPLFQEICLRPSKTSKIDWDSYRKVESWDPKSGRGLYITGESGKGKTAAIWALARRLERSYGIIPENVTSPSLARNLSLSAREIDSKYVDRLASCPVLIIDDFGKEKFTEATTVGIYEIIDRRYNGGKPVVLTSRYGGKQLQGRFEVSQDSNMGFDICRRLGEMIKRLDFK